MLGFQVHWTSWQGMGKNLPGAEHDVPTSPSSDVNMLVTLGVNVLFFQQNYSRISFLS